MPSVDNTDYDLVVYTDGASKNNQDSITSKAGFGVWFGHNDPRNLAERCPGQQTNNRAEFLALIRALEIIPHHQQRILLKTDSQYCIDCITTWYNSWVKQGWRKSNGEPVLNAPLIRYLKALYDERLFSGQEVKFAHVKGHSGVVGNEGADALANAGCLLSLPMDEEHDWDAFAIYVGERKLETTRRVQGGKRAFVYELL